MYHHEQMIEFYNGDTLGLEVKKIYVVPILKSFRGYSDYSTGLRALTTQYLT